MHLRIRLFGGTLKLKSQRYLRTAESAGEVPVWRLGRYYLVWWPNGQAHRPRREKA